jgi:hypothetical protein
VKITKGVREMRSGLRVLAGAPGRIRTCDRLLRRYVPCDRDGA